MEVAGQLGTTRATVGKWRRRFLRDGCDGLLDEPRPGAPRTIGDEGVERVVVKTLESLPPGATHWSTRSMAKVCGLSAATVSRIWRAFALKPHRYETFKLSRDPQFIEKVRDIVGLYLHPPERAVVLCVDEKAQIQALDRMQPVLPMRPGTPGATYARLPPARHHVAVRGLERGHRCGDRQVLPAPPRRGVPQVPHHHRQVSSRRPRRSSSLVLDNYGTHKTVMIHDWLARRPRFHVHYFTPTSASWINQVGRACRPRSRRTRRPRRPGDHLPLHSATRARLIPPCQRLVATINTLATNDTPAPSRAGSAT